MIWNLGTFTCVQAGCLGQQARRTRYYHLHLGPSVCFLAVTFPRTPVRPTSRPDPVVVPAAFQRKGKRGVSPIFRSPRGCALPPPCMNPRSLSGLAEPLCRPGRGAGGARAADSAPPVPWGPVGLGLGIPKAITKRG